MPEGDVPPVIMLALSTFRRSEAAVERALAEATDGGRLLVVYVVDVNLARYLIGADLGYYPQVRQSCEEKLLNQHRADGKKAVQEIAARAEAAGVEVETVVRTGCFAPVCMGFIDVVHPTAIVTTRSQRPAWVKRFFGSPVDLLITACGCRVIEV